MWQSHSSLKSLRETGSTNLCYATNDSIFEAGKDNCALDYDFVAQRLGEQPGRDAPLLVLCRMANVSMTRISKLALLRAS